MATTQNPGITLLKAFDPVGLLNNSARLADSRRSTSVADAAQLNAIATGALTTDYEKIKNFVVIEDGVPKFSFDGATAEDYNKLADYYAWTMFPFGRMIRDVAHPEQSILQNPMRIPEKVFGFPMTDMAKEVKKIQNSQDKNPVPGFKMSSY